jgi:16S rRNA (cytidine1402-2'-O)-methyltransferase
MIGMATLYLVSTPIGNLEDITLRALRVLREVQVIAAEDTRHTRYLLKHYEIATPCISYHHHNRHERIERVLATLATGDVALVSDAGTPGLSDPGFELVQACLAAGVAVSPLPGASAPTSALVASGLPTDTFLYLGFLPRQKNERQRLLTSIAPLTATLVCFEAPHRLQGTLEAALAVLGDRQMVVAREMTKLHEEFVRGTISEVQAHFASHHPRGECTLVIAGNSSAPGQAAHTISTSSTITAPPAPPDEATILEHFKQHQADGKSTSAAARLVAKELGVPKGEVYRLAVGEESG